MATSGSLSSIRKPAIDVLGPSPPWHLLFKLVFPLWPISEAGRGIFGSPELDFNIAFTNMALNRTAIDGLLGSWNWYLLGALGLRSHAEKDCSQLFAAFLYTLHTQEQEAADSNRLRVLSQDAATDRQDGLGEDPPGFW